MGPCATCGQTLREGDRFCMRCGAEREPVSAELAWEYATIAARPAETSSPARGERQSGGPARGASRWVYEAIGEHLARDRFVVARSPAFLAADATFGPTFDWNGRLEGHDALAALLAQLRNEGWEVLADQQNLDLLLSRLSTTGHLRALGETMGQEQPVWSQLTLRRPVKPRKL